MDGLLGGGADDAVERCVCATGPRAWTLAPESITNWMVSTEGLVTASCNGVAAESIERCTDVSEILGALEAACHDRAV